MARSPPARYARSQAVLPDPRQLYPAAALAPLPPRAARLVLCFSGAYRGHRGKTVEDSQIIRVSAGGWVGWTTRVSCPVGAALDFGGDVPGRGAAGGGGGTPKCSVCRETDPNHEEKKV